MMCVLFQFFDPMHHCFNFPDYQLVPTLEEFSQLLGVPVLDQIPFTGLEETPKPEVISESLHLKRSDVITNWETRSGVKGFLAKFLLEKAHSFWEDMDFQAFEDVFALLIYGLVLFPNPDQLVDVNSIKALAKGQEDLKALMIKDKKKKMKKTVGVLNMGRRFRGPAKRALDFATSPGEGDNHEEKNKEGNDIPESEEDEADYSKEQYPPTDDKYK
ncbi:unnamed protein product [Vicia faba]|uniref:DUF7745 domain-containing protein n=1 Tax=Vicia faba TaxID=3906 RepID=A0AAV1A166_VICFA|nr:unnamed protein product [Vicia faba]